MEASKLYVKEKRDEGKTPAQREDLRNGLVKLVLMIVELLRQVLERQAVRMVSAGKLSDNEVERLGLAFVEIKQKMDEISQQFGISPEELDVSLGSLVKSENATLGQTSLVDVIDMLLKKGTVIAGQIKIAVADIDLIALNIIATLSALSTEEDVRMAQKEVKQIG